MNEQWTVHLLHNVLIFFKGIIHPNYSCTGATEVML